MNRRKFLQFTTTAGSSLLLTPGDAFSALEKPSFTVNKDFELKILATNWGFKGGIDAFCEAVKKEGYDGIEIWWPGTEQEQQDLFTALKKHELEVGFLCGGSQSDPKQHLADFKKATEAAATQTSQRPLYINCHSGRDFFSMDDNKKFIDHTIALSKDTKIIICHETHRSRIMYAAHVAKQYIDQYPELRLTFDVSHWCNVHESLLDDQKNTVDLALERVDHIHARIGHQEGPQVNDPRASEWSDVVKAHFTWWDKVVEMKKKAGKRLTILTEFGPPNYMPTLPYTVQPIANQWGINVHMMQILRKRYS